MTEYVFRVTINANEDGPEPNDWTAHDLEYAINAAFPNLLADGVFTFTVQEAHA